MPIRDTGNTIRFSEALDSHRDPDFFVRSCNHVIAERGWDEVVIEADDLGRVFPNASVPISAVIDYHQARGVRFVLPEVSTSRLSFLRPFDAATVATNSYRGDVLSRVWRFDGDSAGQLADALVHTIIERVPMSSGVADAFNWCLWEVMDNVLQHSEAERGFVEAQVHTTAGRLAVCVADAGIGILESFRNSKHRPQNEVDAITLAVQERVTRDPSIGQGNGLWGLYRIASLNDGMLRITSGRGSLFVRDQEPLQTASESIPVSRDNPGTIVDFQIPTAQVIDVSGALGHMPVNTILESFESDSDGLVIRVHDTARGTGTRRSAQALRNTVLNLLQSSGSTITLDFDEVSLISSSFADELVAKLVSELGFVSFQQAIRLTNLNDVTRKMINRSVALRLAEDQGIAAPA